MIAIVLSHFEDHKTLFRTLMSFEAQKDKGFILIVADDGSRLPPPTQLPLSSDQIEQKIGACVRFYSYMKPQGLYSMAATLNQAARSAMAEFSEISRFVFTNHDWWHDGSLVTVLKRLEEDVVAAGLYFQICDPDLVPTDGILTFLETEALDLTTTYDEAGNILLSDIDYRKFWGGQLSISKKLFEAMGGYNSARYQWGYEDIELTKQCLKLGARLLRIPVRTYHLRHPVRPWKTDVLEKKQIASEHNVQRSTQDETDVHHLALLEPKLFNPVLLSIQQRLGEKVKSCGINNKTFELSIPRSKPFDLSLKVAVKIYEALTSVNDLCQIGVDRLECELHGFTVFRRNGFHTPQELATAELDGKAVLVTHWVEGVPFRELKSQADRLSALKSLARELAHLHKVRPPDVARRTNLDKTIASIESIELGEFVQSPTEKIIELAERLGKRVDRSENVLLHGDLNLSNVLMSNDGQLTFLDLEEWCVGPRWIDFGTVANVISETFGSIATDVFVRTYLNTAGDDDVAILAQRALAYIQVACYFGFMRRGIERGIHVCFDPVTLSKPKIIRHLIEAAESLAVNAGVIHTRELSKNRRLARK